MVKHKDRICTLCGNMYTPTGPASRYCTPCSAVRHAEVRADITRRYRESRGCKLGVGKGGANTSFTEDSQYRNGLSRFSKIRSSIRLSRRFCNRCSKDLLDASRYHWVVHHMDHNRANNVESNLELLCKRCHQLEHNCTDNLKG